jgi:hypothetical protein
MRYDTTKGGGVMNRSQSNPALKFTIPQEGLKLLACITMLIDHLGAVFFPDAQILRIIGRLSYPLYAFLLAEGIHYTRSPLKYGLRLLLVAIVTEYPYDLLFRGEFTWAKNSVMITLLLGYCAGIVMKRYPGWFKLIAGLPFILAGRYANGTYGMYGVVMILMFLVTREMPYRLAVQTALMILLSLRMAGFPSRLSTQIFALAAMVPICLYSGQKRSHSKTLQWGFTLFYPLHIILILLIKGI